MELISILILVVCFLLLVVSILILFKISKKADSINKSQQVVSDSIINIVLKDDSFENVNQLIDSLINDAITMYYILSGVVEESYITQKTAVEIQAYVSGMVKKNMTDAVLSTIKLFYKVDTEKELDDLLNLRIKLHLISEVTKQNLPVE